jgi:hypothetical protein
MSFSLARTKETYGVGASIGEICYIPYDMTMTDRLTLTDRKNLELNFNIKHGGDLVFTKF